MNSGKRFISQRYFADSDKYEVLDLMDVPTKTQQGKDLAQALEGGKSVVLNLNLPTAADRARVLKTVRSVSPNIRVRCIYVEDVDEKLSFHLDMFREKVSGVKHHAQTSYKSYANEEMPRIPPDYRDALMQAAEGAAVRDGIARAGVGKVRVQ